MVHRRLINIYNEGEVLALSYKEILVLQQILSKTPALKIQKVLLLFVVLFFMYIVFKKVLKLTLIITRE